MSAPVISVGPESTCRQAIEVMTRKRLGAVVVCENGAARGIFTERDVIDRASTEDRSWLDESISRHMTRNPITIDQAADWHEGLDRMTASTIRHLPVTADGVVVGMLSNRDMTVHRTEELERVVAARTASLELQNIELARRDKRRSYDLDLARQVHSQLLPSGTPKQDWLKVATHYRPYDKVGGDFYEFLRHDEDTLEILSVDAPGHGVAASLIAAVAKIVYLKTSQLRLRPSEIVSSIGEDLQTLLPYVFLTLALCRFRRSTQEVTVASAAHPPMLVFRRDSSEMELIPATGTLLGVSLDLGYEDVCTRLGPGDQMLIFTDGLTECEKDTGETLEQEGVERIVRAGRGQDIDSLVQLLAATVQPENGWVAHDDFTIIGVAPLG